MLWTLLQEGLWTSGKVFIITLIFSLPLGLIVALLRMRGGVMSFITRIYITTMRGTPLLLQLMFVFFGLPLLPLPIVLSRAMAIYVAFVLNYAAYFAEIFRSGFQSIPTGQIEASKMLGLSPWYTLKNILLPQVIKMILPSLGNEVITLVKDTSLVYVLGVTDILKSARAVSMTYGSFTPYLIVALVYLLLIALLSRLLRSMEKRYDYDQ